MSLLARAKLSSTWRRRISVQSIAALQQLNFYSTTKTPLTPKTQRSTRTQKPSQSPTSSEKIDKPTAPVIGCPKPIEIPYQARVANSVNLIGRVKTPVQFDSSDPDGKHSAAAVIYQEDGGGFSPLLIPVVFGGDLAHVVALHVKENDRVYISGQLSSGPTRFSFNEGLGRVHLVAENLNFVEGFPKYPSGKTPVLPVVKIEKPLKEENKPLDEEEKSEPIDEEFNQKWKEALENAKVKRFSGEPDWASSSNAIEPERGSENVKQSVVESVGIKKDRDSILDLWRDLVKSPNQWWDYRGHKSNGLVKERFPDFKHKETGDGLWVNKAPHWVLSGLGKLEFDVKLIKEKSEFGSKFGKGEGGEDSWKDLVENPSKWWDNRLDKRHPRAPDFKNKETGQGLWLDSSPDWARSKLSDSKKNTEAAV